MPDYAERPEWKGSIEASKDFIWSNGLRFLRHYQLKAIQALQGAVAEGKDSFLFEMATGTGKTLTSAAVIRLFLRTQNAGRFCFWLTAWNWKTRHGKLYRIPETRLQHFHFQRTQKRLAKSGHFGYNHSIADAQRQVPL
jgi:primosomal protein N'